MENHRGILINLPISLLRRLDEAAAAMEVSRSEVIRRGLKRDVEFVLKEEVPSILAAREKVMIDYRRWLSYNSNN